MIRFDCDYSEGAHPNILESLINSNMEQTPAYGKDGFCESARRLIRAACEREDMDVHFLAGGTQANMTVISAALRPHQAVISPETGHIANHEAGAIEATGHKVITIATANGKIHADQARALIDAHWDASNHEHKAQPGMVFLSQPTETGLIYNKSELTAFHKLCREKGVLLYVDGARLGYALASEENDVSIADLAELCDVFYIGGTKVGALFGEAVCICDESLKKDFRYHIKQRGGLLAKGRVLGLQFEALFKDDLYFKISKKAVNQAMRIKTAFKELGCDFLYDSTTNQQFPILSGTALDELSKRYFFLVWKKIEDERTAVRFVTSWATKDESVDSLVEDIGKLTRL